ncbi:MAG TPA: class II aldolase/adducin family protein [Solirubrobacteraceae bacterium]|nr:class II aldolase/adducin family protein [Solirubrobacteraceae bacterium]
MASSTETVAAREHVAEAARRLAAQGLVVGTAGNVSERVNDHHVAISPTGATLEALTPEQVCVIDLDGELVGGELEPTSELTLHLGVYQRYDAGAVVHTHSPMATAVACSVDEVPVVHYHMLALGGSVQVAPYATFGTPELAELTLDALDGRSAALMANHGAIVYAADAPAAVESALLLEWACSVYWHASALGPPRVLDPEQQHAVVSAVLERGYGQVRPGAR